MSRYIDADAVIEGIANNFYDEASTAEAFDMVNKVCDYITDAPSINIVRCKECKRANHELSGIYCGLSDVNMGEDGYCSIGERREP